MSMETFTMHGPEEPGDHRVTVEFSDRFLDRVMDRFGHRLPGTLGSVSNHARSRTWNAINPPPPTQMSMDLGDDTELTGTIDAVRVAAGNQGVDLSPAEALELLEDDEPERDEAVDVVYDAMAIAQEQGVDLTFSEAAGMVFGG